MVIEPVAVFIMGVATSVVGNLITSFFSGRTASVTRRDLESMVAAELARRNHGQIEAEQLVRQAMVEIGELAKRHEELVWKEDALELRGGRSRALKLRVGGTFPVLGRQAIQRRVDEAIKRLNQIAQERLPTSLPRGANGSRDLGAIEDSQGSTDRSERVTVLEPHDRAYWRKRFRRAQEAVQARRALDEEPQP